MAAVGSLLVRIGADTGGLRRGGRQAQRVMGGMASQARSTANRLGKFTAAAAAAAAAVGGKLVAEQLRAVDAMSKMSRSLDISTQSATAYAKAFRDVGLDTDDVSDALGTLADRSQDAVDGMQSMTDDFKLVGLGVEDLRGKNPEQLFRTMAQAVADTEDPTKRAAAVVRTFGDDLGRKLMPLLMEGPAALDEYRRKVDQLGLSFSAMEGAKVEQANRAMRNVRDAVSGAARQLSIHLAPILEAIANKFTNMAGEAGGMGAVVEAAVGRAVQVVGVFADGLHGLRIAFAGLKVIATGFSAAFWTVIQELAKGMARLGAMINGVVNNAIKAFNAIPGIGDIPLLSEDVNPPFLKTLQGIGKQARDNLGDAKSAMHELAMQELPSERIKRWVGDVQAGADKAAAAAVAAKKRIAATAGGGGDEGGGDKQTEEERKRMREDLELMRAKLEGERAMTDLHYAKKIRRLREFKEAGLVTDKEFNEREAQIQAAHEKKITENKKKEEKKREDLAQESWNVQRNAAMGALSDITSALGKENDKQTKIQKAAAVARAVMTGWEAAVNAWNAGMSVGGPWAPAVAAAYTAASLAKTASQINAIRSASTGGGGGSGGGGSAGTTGAGAAAQAQQQEQRREATINVQGDSFGGETISRLAEEMGEFLTDGGRLGRVNVQRS